MTMRALIMIHDGAADVAQQVRACWSYVAATGHLVLSGVLHQGAEPEDVVARVAAGEAAVVVAAYRRPELDLTVRLAEVGGTVLYARPGDNRDRRLPAS
jgi:hypothetical protein